MKRWIARSMLTASLLIALVVGASASEPVQPLSVRGDASPVTTSTPIGQEAHTEALAIVPILTQPFSTSAMPPAGWRTASYGTSTRHWTIIDGATFPTWVHSGSYAAWVNWDDSWDRISLPPLQDEWLYSAPVSIPAAQPDATLSFWALASTTYLTATVTVYAVDSAGLHKLWSLDDQNWPSFGYRKVQVDLSAYQGKRIQIAWRYHGFDGDSFGLDDVFISARAQALFIPLVLRQ